MTGKGEEIRYMRLGKYKYPIECFLEVEKRFVEVDGELVRVKVEDISKENRWFEGVKGRLVRDRRIRPRLPEHLQNRYKCPDCGSWLNDEYEGHYACENCPYVAWDKVINRKGRTRS